MVGSDRSLYHFYQSYATYKSNGEDMEIPEVCFLVCICGGGMKKKKSFFFFNQSISH
jgi:hypothetical protein